MVHSDPDWRQIGEDAERVKKVVLDFQAAAFGHAQVYTTVVIFGGYAAIFALWNFTREHLPPTTVYWVGLLTGISVLTFVMYEIFAMLVRSRDFMKVAALLSRELLPAEFLAQHALLAQQQNTFMQRVTIPVWIFALVITVVTGVGAATMLLYSFANALAVANA